LAFPNVLTLGPLVASAEQDDDSLAAPGEINPVSRPVIDAKLANRTSDRLGITEVSSGNPADPANDLQAGALIAQAESQLAKSGVSRTSIMQRL
jgi:hypothetical protein